MEHCKHIGSPISDKQEQRKAAELAAEELDNKHSIGWLEEVRIGLVALCTIAVWLRLWEPFPYISLIGLAGVLIGGWPIFKEAAENIVSRRMTMELSMSIAIIAATAIGEFLYCSYHHIVRPVCGGARKPDGRPRTAGHSRFVGVSASVRHDSLCWRCPPSFC
jgi:Cd2+/Zn2+-exporting ATPase/Cu+-exporting ATPase